jgi:DHA2 family multidrug resistance protein
MSVAGFAMFIGGPIAGAMTKRYDPRFVVAVGPARWLPSVRG